MFASLIELNQLYSTVIVFSHQQHHEKYSSLKKTDEFESYGFWLMATKLMTKYD